MLTLMAKYLKSQSSLPIFLHKRNIFQNKHGTYIPIYLFYALNIVFFQTPHEDTWSACFIAEKQLTSFSWENMKNLRFGIGEFLDVSFWVNLQGGHHREELKRRALLFKL